MCIGSRRRKCISECGESKVLVIRRLRCTQCRRIHHELPDCLVPYKRYEVNSIESVAMDPPAHEDIAADDSTLYRWRKWVHSLLPYWLGCLQAIAIRYQQAPVKERSVPSQSAHHPFGPYVGDAPGWLARIVQTLTHLNLWVHTRSAFLSGNT
ncbi:DUF6431 domain-containing protein [Ammoniphilus sp. CFH 90114]|uniref:DUF6431 domain-containing protein n=1 Tax=Ammoniphilus sp. CFH 90114 TaxID=2493665 RepID=UPI001F0C95FF|nr:DUF6431 domain-containing protein [Ammoniphilus sp. CFH 90114]